MRQHNHHLTPSTMPKNHDSERIGVVTRNKHAIFLTIPSSLLSSTSQFLPLFYRFSHSPCAAEHCTPGNRTSINLPEIHSICKSENYYYLSMVFLNTPESNAPLPQINFLIFQFSNLTFRFAAPHSHSRLKSIINFNCINIKYSVFFFAQFNYWPPFFFSSSLFQFLAFSFW